MQELIQGSEEWLAWRAKGIGASDAAAILGICPYRSKKQLLLEKLGRGKPQKKNPAMALGNKFEGAARALLYFELDVEFTPHTLSHPDHPFILASFDGYCANSEQIAEIKYMGQKNFDLIKKTNKPLEHHFPQVQQQLAVSTFKKCVYCFYTLNENRSAIANLAHIEVERDDQYIDQTLIPALTDFWSEVQRRKVDSNA